VTGVNRSGIGFATAEAFVSTKAYEDMAAVPVEKD
jgi:hypothetical protein